MLKRCILPAILFLLSGTVFAGELPDGPHIVVSGSAKINVMPDIATLDIEVNTTGKDAATAKQQADKRVSQYIDFLRHQGVQKADINTANLRTQADYDYQNGKRTLKGYQATRNVYVTVRQLDQVDNLLNGALKAGLNEIRSLTPTVAKPEQYRQQVREAAIANAISRAKQLAAGFHSQLGTIYSVRYHAGNYQPAPVMRVMQNHADASTKQAGNYDIAPIEFTDRLEAVFTLIPDASGAKSK